VRRDEMLTLLRAAVRSTERIAAELRPLLSDPFAIVAALQFLAAEYSRRTGAPCGLDLDESAELEERVSLAVFRAAQDWLRGARMDRAGPVRIGLTLARREVFLQLRDQGTAPFAEGGARGQALGVIRERARLLGGTASLESRPGVGTLVNVRFPRATAADSQPLAPPLGE
jgi:signal transduction histidine kinase